MGLKEGKETRKRGRREVDQGFELFPYAKPRTGQSCSQVLISPCYVMTLSIFFKGKSKQGGIFRFAVYLPSSGAFPWF